MHGYIKTGRFGDFVKGVMAEEYRRRQEESRKDEDMKLWIMYCHSYSSKTFGDWKKEVLRPAASENKAGGDDSLDGDGIKAIMNDLFPEG